MYSGYGKRLSEIRSDFNLNQDEFGLKVGAHKKSVGNFENEKNLPNMKYIISVCIEFNANAHWILFGVGEKYIDPDKPGKGNTEEAIEEIFSRLKELESKVNK